MRDDFPHLFFWSGLPSRSRIFDLWIIKPILTAFLRFDGKNDISQVFIFGIRILKNSNNYWVVGLGQKTAIRMGISGQTIQLP